MELVELLKIAVERKASDLHIKVGMPPVLRIDHKLVPLMELPRLGQDAVVSMAASVMTAKQRERFKERNEADLAYGVPGLGRFRVNIFQQRGMVGVVLRLIPLKIQTVRELNLPPVLETLSLEQRGLILVTGTTGSGKSSTLAAMLDHINSNTTGHILTIEDPIEFLHRDKKCLVNQREIGVDAPSFSEALRSALRQDPDVILVGEMRDFETISTALLAAETGHLVMSTLHTLDATETINRVVAVFPPYQQKQVRLQLACASAPSSAASAAERGIKPLGLRERPGVPVEEKAAGAVALGQAVLHQPVHQVVGNERARVRVGPELEPQRGLVANRGSDDVAGRDLRHAQHAADRLCLRALAGSRCAEQDDVHG